MRSGFISGRTYHIIFLDHCTGDEGSIVIDMVGTIHKETEHDVILSTWTLLDDCEETCKNNNEYFSIVKSTIYKKRLLPKSQIPKKLLEKINKKV